MYVCTTYFQYVYTMYFRVVNVSMLAYACVFSIWVFTCMRSQYLAFLTFNQP